MCNQNYKIQFMCNKNDQFYFSHYIFRPLLTYNHCVKSPNRFKNGRFSRGQTALTVRFVRKPDLNWIRLQSEHAHLVVSWVLTNVSLLRPRTGNTAAAGHASPGRAEDDEEGGGEPPQRPERCQRPGLQQKRGQ